jgi:hypothetical protein
MLRRQMWENARLVFFHHLLPCPPSVNGCPYGVHFNALLNQSTRLLNVLGQLNWNNLVEGYSVPGFSLLHRLLKFLDWLLQDVSYQLIHLDHSNCRLF